MCRVQRKLLLIALCNLMYQKPSNKTVKNICLKNSILKLRSGFDSPGKLNVQHSAFAKWNWWRLKHLKTIFTHEFPFHTKCSIYLHSGIHLMYRPFCWTDAWVLTTSQFYFHW